MMYLALGYIQADERPGRLFDEVLLNRALQQEIATVLTEHFAISAGESAEVVDSYADDIHDRRHATYGLDEEEEDAEDHEPESNV